MRVAHFVQRYPPALGGSEAFFARLSRHLVSVGDKVTVFTTTALDLEAFWSAGARCLEAGSGNEDGVEVRRYPLCHFPGRRYALRTLSLVPHRLWQCLTLPCNPISWPMWQDAGAIGEPFDIVHATAFPYAWPIACGRRLARRLGVPFLLTPFLHLGDPDDRRDPSRRAYLSAALLFLIQAADRVFVQTELERHALLEASIPAEKLVLLGMGVAAEECTGGDRQRIRHEWGVRDGEVVVGHLANNSEEKGSVDLLRASELAWASGSCFRLLLAGPEMPNFQRYWKSYNQAAQVKRLGVLSETQKRDFFAGLDIFALPSKSDSFGLVLLEAWANGVANVAYRAGGVAEVIRDQKDGLLVRCGDVPALAAALTKLVNNEGLRKHLGHTGFERCRMEFRWEEKLERVRQVYAELKGNVDNLAPEKA